jgi:amidohydrolase
MNNEASGTLLSRARQSAERAFGIARELSHKIHENPELAFEEHKASSWLAEELAALGYTVDRNVGGLETAVIGEYGQGDLTVAICAEYDALPGIGHACGHNVISGAALVAAASLVPIAQDAGLTIRVVGTPAEEAGGGKIILLEAGVFTGSNFAMMIHPAAGESDRMKVNASKFLKVAFHGREAHASGFPQLGLNALDAMTVAQTAIGLLRQHIYPYDKVHGIITNGGSAPNIIPALVEGSYIVRSRSLADLAPLSERVAKCFQAGALATGCELDLEEPWPPYSEFITDEDLAGIYVEKATELGRRIPDDLPVLEAATDMANLSLEMPAIHPLVSINSWPAVNHQAEFTEAAKSAAADKAMFEGGLAMAETVIAAATGPLRSRLLSHSCR